MTDIVYLPTGHGTFGKSKILSKLEKFNPDFVTIESPWASILAHAYYKPNGSLLFWPLSKFSY